MKENMEKIAALLNKTELTEEEGQQIGKLIGSAYNTLSYDKLSAELISFLEKLGKIRLQAMIAMIAQENAWEWKCSNFDHWDDRKKASLSFSYKNLDKFKDMFFENAGFALEVVRPDENYFLYAIDKRPIKNTYLKGILVWWMTEHSTIKQAFFGTTCKALGFEEQGYLPPLNYDSLIFPFI